VIDGGTSIHHHNLRIREVANMELIILILAIAMVVPLPLEEIVGGYGRLALAVVGFLLIFRWLIKNDQKKDQSPQG
jgi:hypothetical protein